MDALIVLAFYSGSSWRSVPDRPCIEPYKQGGVLDWIAFYGIGTTIRIGQESWCLPYAGFFNKMFELLLFEVPATT